MADEITIETGEGSAEKAATEVLAEVAKDAIQETAERTEAVTLAIAEMTHFRGDLSELRAAFDQHVLGNQVDFIAMQERITALEKGQTVMVEALNAEATVVEELLREEIREEIEAEEEAEEVEEIEEVAEEISGAADVSEALAEEPTPPTHHEEHAAETPSSKKRRHFVRI